MCETQCTNKPEKLCKKCTVTFTREIPTMLAFGTTWMVVATLQWKWKVTSNQ